MPLSSYIKDAIRRGIWASSPQANANLNARPGESPLVVADGYEEPYSSNGGNKPTREQYNYNIRLAWAVANAIATHGHGEEWDNEVPYDHPAIVLAGSRPDAYISVQDSTGVDPAADSDASHWRRLVPDMVAVPNASTTRAGIAVKATQADADAGTDANDYMTPVLSRRVADARAALRAPNATETRRGIAELATVAEATAGTDTVRVVTPAGLAARTPAASTTAAGLAEFATAAETQAASDSRVVTPSTLPLHKITVFTGARPPASAANRVEFFVKVES